MRSNIYITHQDLERLQTLVEGLKTNPSSEAGNISALEEELDRARVVDAAAIKKGIVTLNSQVRIRDLDTGKVADYEVVFPNTRARSSAYPLSVLAPLGTALLGYRAGDIVEWRMPKGTRRLKLMQVTS